jgi:hypothetical protein
MRLRKNHALRPQLTEQALARCRTLVDEAKKHGRDRVWVRGQLYAEFDADCSRIVECVLYETKATLD